MFLLTPFVLVSIHSISEIALRNWRIKNWRGSRNYFRLEKTRRSHATTLRFNNKYLTHFDTFETNRILKAQHLISAIAENEYQWDTTSWYLGEDKCNIEFSAKNPDKPVTQENLNALESLVNKSIREARPVGVKVVLNDESESSGNPESDRKDPSRHHGALRVVVIEGIDSNQCCGTHVSSTSELQVFFYDVISSNQITYAEL